MAQEKPWGKQAVKEAIIATSTKLFAAKGVNSVSLRDIASAANVNLGLIARHFVSKEALVREVGLTLVNSMINETIDQGKSIFDIMLKGFDDDSLRLRALTRIILDDTDYSLTADAKVLFDKLLDWIKAQQKEQNIKPELDPMILLFIIASMVMGNELLGPHINAIMKLTSTSFQEIKPQILQTVIEQLKQKS